EVKLKDVQAQAVMQFIRPMLADGSSIETPAEDTIRISSAEAQELLVRIIESLSRNSIQIESVSVNPPTLEEVFLAAIDNSNQS
ncbi:MAG: multidrug ABC transporter ATP-binding protein, partial [Nitrososphaera sp.]